MSTEGRSAVPRVLVISGVGMTEGGILSVLRNVVASAERVLGPEWRIVVLAHRRELIPHFRAQVLEFPSIKSSWFRRLNFEWRTSRQIARDNSAEAWLAMHDITPLVDVPRQFVYCHNPTCFSRPTLRSLYFDWIFVAHSLFYGWLYALNIRRNEAVFVQQSWIRKAFLDRFGAERVVVARPTVPVVGAPTIRASPKHLPQRWLYPTFPRHFKNVEVIGEALQLLEGKGWNGKVLLTIEGSENRYARSLRRRFGHVKSLEFIGRQDSAAMNALYDSVDGLLFPSVLETWGLPIGEAQSHDLPLLVADLPYAHETVGSYHAVRFFDPHDALTLAKLLEGLANGSERWLAVTAKADESVPIVVGWDELVREVCR